MRSREKPKIVAFDPENPVALLFCDSNRFSLPACAVTPYLESIGEANGVRTFRVLKIGAASWPRQVSVLLLDWRSNNLKNDHSKRL
jgi:hypothetical protein